MKKLLNFVLVAIIAVSFATNVYADGGEGRINISSFDDYATLADLWAAIPSLGIREASYYTNASYTNYINYYNLAYTTINDDSVDDATRLAYKNHLINAINGLKPVVDYSGLNAAIERYNNENNSDLYQPVLWEYVEDAHTEAVALIAADLEKTENNQKMVNRIANKLNEKLNNLLPIEESAANETAKEMYQYREIADDRDSYEEKSFNEYRDAYMWVTTDMRDTRYNNGAGYTKVSEINPENSVEEEILDGRYSFTLKTYREALVPLYGTVGTVTTPVVDPELPPIPNTADTVVSYIIMMLIGMFGITVFGRKLANSK